MKWEQVYDANGIRSRGLWKRGSMFYVQTTVVDPQTGLKGIRRLALPNCATEPQARKAAESVKPKALHAEIYRKQGSPYLADYISHYLANCHKSDHTKDNEECYLKKWLQWFGNVRLSNITTAQILSYRTECLKPDANGKTLSKRTVNVRVNALKSLLKFAKMENKIEKNPAGEIVELSHHYKTKALLETSQIENIINTAESFCPRSGKQFSDFVKLCCYSGGRMNEILSLTWDKVNFNTNMLEIFGKGSKTRFVHFNPKLESHLKDMHARKTTSNWLFPSQRSESRITTFKKTLTKIREKTGLEFSNHSFRHYFASMAVMAGIDFMTISRMLGHSDGGTLVGKVYGHLNDQHQKDAAKKLTNL